MGVLTRAEKRRARQVDWISTLPDDILSNIVSLLPTKDGARTQILSSRWRHLWHSAPLNLDFNDDDLVGPGNHASEISHILSTHPGPGRRFVMPWRYTNYDYPTYTILDCWLRSPALNNLQELKFDHYPRPLPPSVCRLSSTLRVASFNGCTFPEGNNGGAFLFQVLESLTLADISISESSLHALLAGCLVLQSFVLVDNHGFSRLEIVSPSLRNISVDTYWRSIVSPQFKLIIEDAPCLEKLQFSEKIQMNISVISAPRLAILGKLYANIPRLQFGATVLLGSTVVSMATVIDSVKVLSLSSVELCLHMAINLLKCFPQLEKLYIKGSSVCAENAWYQTDPERIGSLNIRLRKIVVEQYQGNKSHVDFVNFFLSNVRMLESLELEVRNITTKKWIAAQKILLHIKSASRGARIKFVPHKKT